MEKRSLLLGAAMAGMMMGLSCTKKTETTPAPTPETATTEQVMGECNGANTCKGQGACGGANHDCAGKNECKGQGWVKLSKEECEKIPGATFKG
ncbi:MAG: hypothetical protein KBD63_07150 [Bacteriovoracaceae bacterium]|nr:hypothetical protein [Bacteriovoracaceae bacterium]